MMAAAANLSPTTAAPFCCCYSQTRQPPTLLLLLSSSRPSFKSSSPPSQPLSRWVSLKPLPFPSISRQTTSEKKGKRSSRRRGLVYASLFGVGAPEALVIGVVALLVFGPKGLAEVARNLGKTLRAFQPTIKELQEVSRDFKSTLEREIGLDEVTPSANYNYKPTSSATESQRATSDPNGLPNSEAYTSEDLLKLTQEQIAVAQTQTPSPQEQPQDSVANAPSERAASTTPEAIAQVPSSEKTEKEK
ncbi:putative sec-independent protein translocase protein TATB, chloroplastic isoform X3 [Iris pallida]|uniref:Sec-independent protein translocase protein TATB, chloroplastic isoform X3 n=1 Tax=Iris pallida TaxID=29817 RepID=A0AAX6G905_IRIPA|nr:putative sec-independent protein translocase protein TATB, chloroplastic isoform X3 [Iris pallida]